MGTEGRLGVGTSASAHLSDHVTKLEMSVPLRRPLGQIPRQSTTPRVGIATKTRATAYAAGMTTEQRALIVRDPKVCHGQATVRGTRIMVSIILDALADGMTESEILAEYPTLTVEGIRAAAAYGAELARDEYPAVAAT